MKKKQTRSIIGNISAFGTTLNDEQLRLVSGGARPVGGKTIPSSITAPGQPDTATDTDGPA